ncbi:Predicted arabinose efflux permease, MFS family [Mesobacillus persicus]|uniref:Predicted arabinose efflux permease, MFS family n=1 Tax=Mesobacillus persicus TaxID=930146 RepID=A0A1H8K447_9BACI|nr:MFS transporter [Mesobacillus persicus]SEN87188.1 Predicted arabinose efflux permease, MFS family [Mesobacillus persicus]
MIENQPRLWTKNFISVSVSNFFLFMTFYFLLVTMPVYVLNELKGKESEAGLATTVFLLSAIIIRPIAGRWIEKFGARSILLSALVLFSLVTLLYLYADSILVLMVIRFIHGIGFGMATTATGSIVAAIIPDSRRGEGMGYFVLSSNLAMVVGPFLGLTIMQQLGVSTMLFIGVISATIGLVAGLFITLPKRDMATVKNNRIKGSFRFKELFEISAIPIAVTGAFFAIVYSSILSFVSVYAVEIGAGNVASYFFVVYAVVLLISRPFTGKWFDLYGANSIAYPAIILFAIGMVILGIADSPTLFLVAAAFAGLGWGTLFPSFQTIAITVAHPKRRPVATATFLSIYDIGIGLGSFLVGLAAANLSIGTLYLFSSVYILIGLVIYHLLQGRYLKKDKNHKEQYLDI